MKLQAEGQQKGSFVSNDNGAVQFVPMCKNC